MVLVTQEMFTGNKVEPLLQENLRAYMAGPRTVSSQAQALENFKAGWAYVVEYCDTPVMGNPGQACVADRQRGGHVPGRFERQVPGHQVYHYVLGAVLDVRFAGGLSGIPAAAKISPHLRRESHGRRY